MRPRTRSLADMAARSRWAKARAPDVSERAPEASVGMEEISAVIRYCFGLGGRNSDCRMRARLGRPVAGRAIPQGAQGATEIDALRRQCILIFSGSNHFKPAAQSMDICGWQRALKRRNSVAQNIQPNHFFHSQLDGKPHIAQGLS